MTKKIKVGLSHSCLLSENLNQSVPCSLLDHNSLLFPWNLIEEGTEMGPLQLFIATVETEAGTSQ